MIASSRAASLGVIALLAVAARADEPVEAGAPRLVRYTCRTMGTRATITLVTPDSIAASDLAFNAQRQFFHVDSLMSNWTETSEVARINRELSLTPLPIDREVASVVKVALAVSAASQGAFDITVEPLVRLWGFVGGTPHVPKREDLERAKDEVGYQRLELVEGVGPTPPTLSIRTRLGPSLASRVPPLKIDLGGLAKGYAVERVAAVLLEAGVTDALVDASGKMRAIGHPPGRTAWRVGIRDPKDRVPMLGEVLLSDRCIATSGQYEHFVSEHGQEYGHILDPRSGWPVEGSLSTTAVCRDALLADAWSTALFALGPEEARRTATRETDMDAIVVAPARPPSDPDRSQDPDTLWLESSLREWFELSPRARQYIVVREF